MRDGPGDYNLLHEPWIPVLWGTGATERVGIWRALTEAGSIRQIAACNPMDDVSLFRFLLAVLQWCKPEMSDEEREWLQGAEGVPEDWLGKLEAAGREGRFNLLGEGERFYQSGVGADEKAGASWDTSPGRTDDVESGHRGANEPRRVSDLFSYLPAATEINHARHILDRSVALCPACCAIGLVRQPACAAQGGQGKSPSINNTPPFYAVPRGGSLLETLALNWPTARVEPGDMAAWEPSTAAVPGESTIGPLEGLTWQPRRAWLGPVVEGAGRRCVRCGAEGPLVSQLVFSAGRSRKGESRSWRDPHVIWVEKGKAGRDNDADSKDSALRGGDAIKYAARGVGLWVHTTRALLESGGVSAPVPALASATERGERTRIHVACAQPFMKQAKTLDEDRDELTIPRVVVTDSELRDTALAELAAVEALDLRRVLSRMSAAKGRVCIPTSATAALLDDIHCRLRNHFRALLAGLGRADSGAAEGSLRQWRMEARGAVREAVVRASSSFSTGSPLRRQEAVHAVAEAVNQPLDKLFPVDGGESTQHSASVAGICEEGERAHGTV